MIGENGRNRGAARRAGIAISLSAFLLVAWPTAGAMGATSTLDSTEQLMLDTLNQERAARDLNTLSVNDKLSEAGDFHTDEMLREGFFEHNSKNRSWSQRVRSFLRAKSVGEIQAIVLTEDNITPEEEVTLIVSKWLDSPAHRKQIVNKKYRRFGIGRSAGSYKGEQAILLTIDFAS